MRLAQIKRTTYAYTKMFVPFLSISLSDISQFYAAITILSELTITCQNLGHTLLRRLGIFLPRLKLPQISNRSNIYTASNTLIIFSNVVPYRNRQPLPNLAFLLIF